MRQIHHTLPNVPIITLPNDFTFKAKGIIDFDNVLDIFDWPVKSKHIIIDTRFCQSIEYQTLTYRITFTMHTTNPYSPSNTKIIILRKC